MKRIYILPNLVTSANMACGFVSVISVADGNFVFAAQLIWAGIIFDMMDGRIARLAKATSSFGVEYDSLSDLITFGMAPAVLYYFWSLGESGISSWPVSFVILISVALRLARFNVSTQIVPKGFFQGLPSPVGAGLLSSFILFQESGAYFTDEFKFIISVCLAVLVSFLMISSIPFPSFKNLNWRSKATRFGFLLGLAALGLVASNPSRYLFTSILITVLLTLAWNVKCKLRGSYPKELQDFLKGSG